ncbi:Protein of unknown function (DUF1479) domain containing protein [Naviculisporaceae sp. PSN 640]
MSLDSNSSAISPLSPPPSNSPHGIDQGVGGGQGVVGAGGRELRRRCSQCNRRQSTCNHHAHHSQASQPPLHPSATLSPVISNANLPSSSSSGSLSAVAAAPLHPRPRRISKLKHRAINAAGVTFKNATTASPADPSSSSAGSAGSAAAAAVKSTTNHSMEPPVLSFYGIEPVPLPTRFAHIKRNLAAGHEAELEASWARLLEALKDEVENISSRGSQITPTIDFSDINDPAKTADFQRQLKACGLGLVRGVVPRADAQTAIDETVKYLERKHDFKEPTVQDPTCFDFFWTPAQVRTRAHPHVLQAQRWAMSLWDNDHDDRMATRFPISYGDRIRIHGANIGGVGPEAQAEKKKVEAANGDDNDNPNSEADAQKAALELLGDFASSTVIAQVDNGSLERWEPDGYGRGGTYQSIFKGEWEKYNPWDPTHRVSATSDLYNGYGACSIFRMYQGVVALSTIEPGLIRLLPSPKLATAYFLLRPFFSPKTKQPERRFGPEWDAYLDASNWTLDREHSTIIHGAVPGHAQRLTERWHPHLHLRKTLVTIPTLQTGDYIVWHPDLAYHIASNPNVMASRAPSPPPPGVDDDESSSSRSVSVLVYVPAAPLTQNSALYLARQRKTFLRGHPTPDFDATGSGLNSEASHVGRPGETEIAEIGGPAGLQAMGLAPFDIAPTPPSDGSTPGDEDVVMEGAETPKSTTSSSATRAEAEVARLANIILFPDRYDFYMGKRNAGGKTPRVRADSSKGKKRDASGKEKEESNGTSASTTSGDGGQGNSSKS